MRRDIVVIGGSAGALDPLKEIAAGLPVELPAAVLAVLHMPASARSSLVAILNRVGGPHAVIPRDGDPVRPGYIYVPTPDHHLELVDSRIAVTKTPRINGVRPAVDVLFRSAAAAYGPRVVGIVLSGGLDDGSAGLAEICAAGGAAIVQSPDEALVDSMPRNAIELAHPDDVLPAAEISAAIARLIGADAPAEQPAYEGEGGLRMAPVGAQDTPGEVTGITCPDCHGSIWLQTGKGGDVAFTCRVGHSYSPESFFEIQSENVENALWAGVRSLEEQASLAGVMASRSTKFGDADTAGRYEARRRIANDNAEVLRKLIVERPDA